MIKTNLPAVTPLTPTVTQTSIKFCFNVTSFAEVSDISYVIYNEATPTEPVETGTVLAVGSFWPYGMEVNVEKEELEYNSGTYVCELTATNANGSTTATQRATLEKYIDWAEPESVVSGNRFMADGVEEIGTLPEKTSVDVTVDGLTVTVPAGAYQESVEVTTEPEPVYDWLCFTAYTDNSTVALTTTTQSAQSVTLYKSTDKENWTEWDGSAITLQNTGDKVWIYGDNNNTMENHRFVITGSVTCSGDMLTLLKRDGDVTFLPTRCFSRLFQDCAGLQSFEKLPALTGSSSYTFLFYGCTALASAPLMPATTLAQSCYDSMFSECTSLSSAPTLPATTLAQSCYSGMFEGCTALTQAPVLPATTLANFCYYQMFWNCTSLTTAPTLSATTLAQNCYAQMFKGCTALTAAPTLNATTLAQSCYQAMFQDCTSLTTAPTLSATTLAQGCYSTMFSGCTSLTTAPALPATDLTGASSCYSSMFSGCTSLTTSPALPATTLASSCYNGMFRESAITQAPTLSATTLAEYCYQNMFFGCTALTAMPTLSATTMMRSSYQGMFKNCTALTTVTDLVATTLARSCYQEMFSGCTALTVSPVLAAADLVQDCYKQMFDGCTLLEEITTYVTVWNTSHTANWVRNVAATGTFNNFGQATIASGVNGIPNGWTERTEPYVPNYFCVSPNFTDTRMGVGSYSESGSIQNPFPNVEYSFDGINWNQLDENNPTVTVSSRVYFRGTNTNGFNAALNGNTPSDVNTIWRFYSNNTIVVSGDIRSILFGDNFENVQIMPAYGLYGFFSNGLVTSSYALELPSTTLGERCYENMFMYNSSLRSAPILPATTLGDYCYKGMFQGCSSMEDPISLPATTLATGCYAQMFGSCESMTTAPALPATTLASNCYNQMFAGCTALTQAPELPATTLAIDCYYQMFYNCSNLGKVVLYYAGQDWLDSDQWPQYSSSWMFGTEFYGVIYNVGGTTLPTSDVSGIPSGWDEINGAPITFSNLSLVIDGVNDNIVSGTMTSSLPCTGNYVRVSADAGNTFELYFVPDSPGSTTLVFDPNREWSGEPSQILSMGSGTCELEYSRDGGSIWEFGTTNWSATAQ